MEIKGLAKAQYQHDIQEPEDDGFDDFIGNLSNEAIESLAKTFITKNHHVVTESVAFQDWLRNRWEDGEV